MGVSLQGSSSTYNRLILGLFFFISFIDHTDLFILGSFTRNIDDLVVLTLEKNSSESSFLTRLPLAGTFVLGSISEKPRSRPLSRDVLWPVYTTPILTILAGN